jgi:glyoxylase-like metal-dependent hydrolase (beta-lactamase superfamily II)
MHLFPTLIVAISLFAGEALSFCSHTTELSDVYAPLPPTALGPTIGPSGYDVEAFGGGAYMVTDGSYQALFLVSDRGVILVDAPPTIGRKISYAIGNVTDLPVTHFVYSHHHTDHAGGAYLFTGKGVPIIAHVDTYYNLAQLPDPKRPLPTVTFHKDYVLKVGNQTLELSYKGPNHEPGNIFIYAPHQKVLMLVDVVYPGWIPFTELAVSTNIPGWIAAHDQLLEYDFKHYVGGHLARSGNRTDVEVQKEYVSDLFANCKKTIELSATDDPVVGAAAVLGVVSKLNPGNSWANFKAYLDVTAEYCANLTNAKWVGRLGAADVFGFENAYKMIESLRIDYDVLGPFAVM